MKKNDFDPFFGFTGQKHLIVMELQHDVWRCLVDVYTMFQIDISKDVQKSPENFSLAGSLAKLPLAMFSSATGPKIAQPWRKLLRFKTLTI